MQEKIRKKAVQIEMSYYRKELNICLMHIGGINLHICGVFICWMFMNASFELQRATDWALTF